MLQIANRIAGSKTVVIYVLRLGSTALLSIVVAVALTGCGGGSNSGGGITSPTTRLSGIAYHEIEGGACCNPPTNIPIASTELSFHSPTSTTPIATATTGATGNYSVMLPAGTYAVDLANRSGSIVYNTVTPAQITIITGQPQTVNLMFVEDVP